MKRSHLFILLLAVFSATSFLNAQNIYGDHEKDVNLKKNDKSSFFVYDPVSREEVSIDLFKNIEDAKSGNPKAQYKLGLCYEKGQGFEADYEKAIYWYKKAAVHIQTFIEIYG